MIRPEIVRKRLQSLDNHLKILEKARQYSYEEFIAEPEHYGSCERFLHLSIEALTDLGNHVIAELNLGTVGWYSDIPKIMNESSYIDDELKEEWIRMIGFRNTLVHEYIDIDRKIVYDVLQNKLGILQKMKRIFAQFLDS